MYRVGIATAILLLTGCASTGEWRALRIDGSNRASFEDSVALFQHELSPARRGVFDLALADIWTSRTEEDTGYVASDYFGLLDGLGYDEVVALADPDAIARQSRTAGALLRQGMAEQDRLDRRTAREGCTAPIC